MKALLVSAILIICSISNASCSQEQESTQRLSAAESSTAFTIPDFGLQDLSGTTRFLKDFRGRTTLLNFTTTWCPYCRREIPSLKNMYSSYRARGFELVSIYVNESRTKVAAFSSQNELPWTILLDPDGSVARMFGVRGVPTKVLVKRDGSIECWPCTSVDEKIKHLVEN
ncbi:MAG: peroxiredoxin family protein [Desulfomonilia bacterium]